MVAAGSVMRAGETHVMGGKSVPGRRQHGHGRLAAFSAAASDTAWASMESVPTGMWLPCCSTEPSGSSRTVRSRSSASISGPVISSQRMDHLSEMVAVFRSRHCHQRMAAAKPADAAVLARHAAEGNVQLPVVRRVVDVDDPGRQCVDEPEGAVEVPRENAATPVRAGWCWRPRAPRRRCRPGSAAPPDRRSLRS